jgi:hypothetical protein
MLPVHSGGLGLEEGPDAFTSSTLSAHALVMRTLSVSSSHYLLLSQGKQETIKFDDLKKKKMSCPAIFTRKFSTSNQPALSPRTMLGKFQAIAEKAEAEKAAAGASSDSDSDDHEGPQKVSTEAEISATSSNAPAAASTVTAPTTTSVSTIAGEAVAAAATTSTTSTTTVTSVSTAPQSAGPKAKVSFTTVRIHVHERAIGRGTVVSSGAPLGLVSK